MSEATPQLSVVMTAYNARNTIERALESIAHQRDACAMEVILIDSSTDGTADFVQERFEWVNVVHYDERKYCGDGRNIGIGMSAAPIIAFFDADCIADPQWAKAVLAAHEKYDDPAIGGAVANGNPESFFGWSYYFTEFTTWAPGSAPRIIDDIPGCSLTLKRSIFDRFGPFVEGTYCSDSAFLWKLTDEGHPPRFEPSIQVAHINPHRFGPIVSHVAMHGEHFGAGRCREQKPSFARLMTWRLGAPLLPWILLARAFREVVVSDLSLPRFLLHMPFVLITQSAWSLGEMRGYWRSRTSPRETVAS